MVDSKNRTIFGCGKWTLCAAAGLAALMLIKGKWIFILSISALSSGSQLFHLHKLFIVLILLSAMLNIFLFYRIFHNKRKVLNYEKMKQRLRLSENRFTKAFQSCPYGLTITSLEEGCLIDVNDTFLIETGYTRKEVIGKTAEMLGMWANPGEHEKIVDGLRQHGSVRNIELKLRIKSGDIREILWSAELIEFQGRMCMIAVNRDITEKKILEARLSQAEKMEAIGTLAGGVAHDFNNILLIISGNAELVYEELPQGTRARDNIEHIQTACWRAKDLVGQILNFSRKSVPRFKPIRISRIIEETLTLVRASLPSTIAIQQTTDAKRDTIMGDATQILQILINLCRNAHHAMTQQGGILEIMLSDTDILPVSASECRELKPGSYAKLSIRDTGHGIDPEIVDRIFEPYFTTKGKGRGTGMGLSVVYGIVQSHQGFIYVSSKPGNGTRFDIYLPLLNHSAESCVPSDDSLPVDSEHILYVDDEEMFAQSGKQMREHQGYPVAIRTSSIEALKAFMANPDRFKLAIKDLTTPNMTGDADIDGAELAIGSGV